MTTQSKTHVLSWLTISNLSEYAESSAYFERGKNYYHQGNVSTLEEEDGIVTGKVIGQETYQVRLWEDGEELGYECDCPLGDGGEFCKHCVAVGLAWINDCQIKPKASPKELSPGAALGKKDVERFLYAQDKSKLVQWLMEQIRKDKQLGNYFKLQAAHHTPEPNLRKLTATYRETIKKAIDIGERNFIEYREARHYQAGVWVVVNSLQDLLSEKPDAHHAHLVIDLVEFALQRVEKATNSIDDSNGGMGEIMYHLVKIHHEACKQATADPEELAGRLFNWALQSQWDNFSDAVSIYADVLGKAGLSTYQKLAEAYWRKMPSIAPGGKSDYSHERSVITRIMEDLAKQTGNVEALVAVKSKKLEYAYNFLTIAELYLEAKKPEKALEWAEKGLQAFPDKTDYRLRDFLANRYHECKQHNKAMNLIWLEYTETPRLDRYQLLKNHAFKLENPDAAWQPWRKKALTFLREKLKADAAKSEKRPWATPTHSHLVEIFVWEKDLEAALKEAKSGGCEMELWLKLAKALENSTPEKAIEIYQAQIPVIVSQTNNRAYQEAFEILKTMHRLMKQIDQAKSFQAYLLKLRQQFQPKRNFMKLLESPELKNG